MFAINLHLAGASAPVGLRYRTEKAAEVAAHNIKTDAVVCDDFGQRVHFRLTDVVAVHIIDIKRDLEAQIVVAQMQHEAQRSVEEKTRLIARPSGLMMPQQ